MPGDTGCSRYPKRERNQNSAAPKTSAQRSAASTMTPVNPRAPIRTAPSPVGSCSGSTILTMMGEGCCTFKSQPRRAALHVKAFESKLRERADGNAGRPFRHIRLRIVGPRGPRDVHVHPRQTAGEFLEKRRGGDRAGRAPAGVHHVGDLALELIAILVEQRQRPGAVAFGVGDTPHLLDPAIRRSEETSRNLPECDDA